MSGATTRAEGVHAEGVTRPLGSAFAARLEHVAKVFDEATTLPPVLDDVSLDGARRASSSACSGASGCGKSTLLNLIAGLDQPDRRAPSRRAGARRP